MSMQTYGLDEAGLLITPEIAAYIILADTRRNAAVEDEVQEMLDRGEFEANAASEDQTLDDLGYLDEALAVEIVDENNDNITQSHGEFTGLATTLEMPGQDELVPRSWDFSDSFVGYIPAAREPSMFKPAYESPEELIREFRDVIGEGLPENFDIRPFIVKIEGYYLA